jgi:ribosomal protein S18 acetylase RimI-like enzyme
MTHLLDRPIWSALTTIHAPLAEGGVLAKRYKPSIHPFTATADDSAESFAALEALVAAGDDALIVQTTPIALPDSFSIVTAASVVQMVAENVPLPTVPIARIAPLTPDDAQDMLALAVLTKPGPFTARAQALGAFWGVKSDGRLIAMAGERLKQPGFTELSGVCTHPEFRGQGLGRFMSVFVANMIAARGEVPYLHCYATNADAIRLYESIGFRVRATLNVVVAKRV